MYFGSTVDKIAERFHMRYEAKNQDDLKICFLNKWEISWGNTSIY